MSELSLIRNIERINVKTLTNILSRDAFDDETKKKIIETLSLPGDFFRQSNSDEEKAIILNDKLHALCTKLTSREEPQVTTAKVEEAAKTTSIIFNPYPIHSMHWWGVQLIMELSTKQQQEKNDPFVSVANVQQVYESKGLSMFKTVVKKIVNDIGEKDENGKVIKASAFPLLSEHFIVIKNLETGAPEKFAFAEE